jgi:hypothetical protein
MKKLVLASLLSVSIWPVAATPAELSGYISDSHCGAKHNIVSEENTKCVTGCLKKADPVLVKDGTVLKFEPGSAAKAKEFAGQNVKIDGREDGDIVTIGSIAKAAE